MSWLPLLLAALATADQPRLYYLIHPPVPTVLEAREQFILWDDHLGWLLWRQEVLGDLRVPGGWIREADEAVRWWAAVLEYREGHVFVDRLGWDWLMPVVGRDRYFAGWSPTRLKPPPAEEMPRCPNGNQKE